MSLYFEKLRLQFNNPEEDLGFNLQRELSGNEQYKLAQTAISEIRRVEQVEGLEPLELDAYVRQESEMRPVAVLSLIKEIYCHPKILPEERLVSCQLLFSFVKNVQPDLIDLEDILTIYVGVLRTENGLNRLPSVLDSIKTLKERVDLFSITNAFTSAEVKTDYSQIEIALNLATPFVLAYPRDAHSILSTFNRYHNPAIEEAVKVVSPYVQDLNVYDQMGVIIQFSRHSDREKASDALLKLNGVKKQIVEKEVLFFKCLLSLDKKLWDSTIPSLIDALNKYHQLFKITTEDNSWFEVLQHLPRLAPYMNDVHDAYRQKAIHSLSKCVPQGEEATMLPQIVAFVKKYGVPRTTISDLSSLKRLLECAKLVYPYLGWRDRDAIEIIELVYSNGGFENCKEALENYQRQEEKGEWYFKNLLHPPGVRIKTIFIGDVINITYSNNS